MLPYTLDGSTVSVSGDGVRQASQQVLHTSKLLCPFFPEVHRTCAQNLEPKNVIPSYDIRLLL